MCCYFNKNQERAESKIAKRPAILSKSESFHKEKSILAASEIREDPGWRHKQVNEALDQQS